MICMIKERFQMAVIYQHEMKLGLKSLAIWFACVAGMGLACILLYSGMQADMEKMAEGFASMGAFSEAFGMDQLSIATLTGFYATEVGTIHGLGGAMFAAVIASGMLSKEEDGHTGEFLFTLPLTREKIVSAKWLAVATDVVLFNVLCVAVYAAGFVVVGEEIPVREFLLYHAMQIVMQLELAAICYGISACMKKTKLGMGLGIVLLLYAYDLMARVIPDLSDYKLVSPFSYANASDILSTGEIAVPAFATGGVILILCLGMAFWVYGKRDLLP